MSERALAREENIILNYVDLLMFKLQNAHASHVVDLQAWMNFTTFDILGDLAFGEPFGCLASGVNHSWIELLNGAVEKFVSMNAFKRIFPGVLPILLRFPALMRPQTLREFFKSFAFCEEKCLAHLDADVDRDRPDFVTYILRANDEKGLTKKEIASSSQILIVAGSETTASALCGDVYYLLKHRSTHQKLVNEVRSSFKHDADITLVSSRSLRYLNAIIEEGLRVHQPAPVTFPRTCPPGGALICGKFVPGGYSVGVAQLATNFSRKNFKEPEKFAPERWLGDPRYAADVRAAHQPFSYGPRDCLGKTLAYAELRLILCKLLWNFDLELQKDSLDWGLGQRITLVRQHRALNIKLKSASSGK